MFDSKEIMRKFGEKIKFYRIQANLTQEQLAERCNCSKQTISGTETGYSFPSSKLLFQLSNVLNVPLFTLFNFGENVETSNEEMCKLISKAISKLNYDQQILILKMIQSLEK